MSLSIMRNMLEGNPGTPEIHNGGFTPKISNNEAYVFGRDPTDPELPSYEWKPKGNIIISDPKLNRHELSRRALVLWMVDGHPSVTSLTDTNKVIVWGSDRSPDLQVQLNSRQSLSAREQRALGDHFNVDVITADQKCVRFTYAGNSSSTLASPSIYWRVDIFNKDPGRELK